MLAASRAEAVREAQKVLLVNLVEGGNHGLLDDLVFQGATPNGRCRPSSFCMYTLLEGNARYAPR